MAKFKTRARTIEMLGRQQIANASTAINEIFKNAYDAYADHVEVDYFRSDNLMVIRDDGMGMTLEDFEGKWLVLGTESKFSQNDNSSVKPNRPTGKPERVIMGEKGIGRLAIALLGRQVLILSRAKRDKQTHDLVMCFIHWGVFEIPGVNLEDIEIPIKMISGLGLPSVKDVHKLVDKLKGSLNKLSQQCKDQNVKKLLKDMENINLDPEDLDNFLDGPSLNNGQSGTHFYIVPADEGIGEDIDRDRKENNKNFSKFLLGFSNSVFRETSLPPIKTAFRDWTSDSIPEDIIESGEFFTEEELQEADHKVSGRFDENGQFQGDVRIFDKLISNHVISWPSNQGAPTNCGPFEIEFGYIMGTQRETGLPPENWVRLVNKLDQIGGLYVYKDRIRILPYGNSDIDWLNIEERRSKGAAYYFFSYRRVFGAIKLSREKNWKLKEKAGREGFQQDKAYRQLKDILENFFIQLTIDFFRKEGDYTEYYDNQRAELSRQDKARKQREKQASTKRKNIASNLEEFFNRVNNGLPQTEVNSLKESIQRKMDTAMRIGDIDETAKVLLHIERDANKELTNIRESYRLNRPRGVGLSETLQREWNLYLTESHRLDKEVFDPLSVEVAETFGKMAQEAKLHIDQKQRLTALIQQQAGSRKQLIKQEAREVENSANDTRDIVIKVTRNAINDVQETITSVETEITETNLNNMSDDEIKNIRENLEGKIITVGRKNRDTLEKIRDMLTTLSENISHDTEIMEADMIEAMDQELMELRDQASYNAEMVQLGLAVAIINHEFETAIRGVRQSIRELRPWAKSNEDLAKLYQEIRNNFEHLDGHLNLFTPLQRRLYRNKIEIKGSAINRYIRDLFHARLNRHNIQLKSSDQFINSKINGYPSTVYPVFVNIIDNAIFWLKEKNEDREIVFDADKNGFLISNNGPSIKQQDYSAIFEQGFTRKPGGRGLGLFISKKSLQKDGLDLEIISVPNKRYNVSLMIKWGDQNDSN